MKCAILLALAPILCLAGAAGNVTNRYMTVDQKGGLNASGVATVEDVATNAVKVQVAEAKMQAVQSAVAAVQSDARTLAASIVSNKVVVYRGSYSEGFTAAVVITEADKLACVGIRLTDFSAGMATFVFKYVCLADIVAVKPTLHVHEALEVGTSRNEFDIVPDGRVSSPAYVPDPVKVGDTTYEGYYQVSFTAPLSTTPDKYFIWVSVDGDVPGSEGQGVSLPNGVKGGFTGSIGDGWDIEVYGGVIMGVIE